MSQQVREKLNAPDFHPPHWARHVLVVVALWLDLVLKLVHLALRSAAAVRRSIAAQRASKEGPADQGTPARPPRRRSKRRRKRGILAVLWRRGMKLLLCLLPPVAGDNPRNQRLRRIDPAIKDHDDDSHLSQDADDSDAGSSCLDSPHQSSQSTRRTTGASEAYLNRDIFSNPASPPASAPSTPLRSRNASECVSTDEDGFSFRRTGQAMAHPSHHVPTGADLWHDNHADIAQDERAAAAFQKISIPRRTLRQRRSSSRPVPLKAPRKVLGPGTSSFHHVGENDEAIAEIVFVNNQQSQWDRDIGFVCVMIPGNPGNASFYREYMGAVHETTGLPCVIFGHTGHSEETRTAIKFSHYKQVQHKLDLMRVVLARYQNAKIVLIGHSIGAWIAMEMIRDEDVLPKQRVSLVINLFPTVHHIGTTPNGKRLFPIVKYLRNPLSKIAALLNALLPEPLLTRIVAWKLAKNNKLAPQVCVEAARSLTFEEVALQAFYMGSCEMEYMGDIDHAHYKDHEQRLIWYFGKTDQWLTDHHVEDIMNLLPESEHYECKMGLPHDFCIHHASEMAELTAEWLKERILS